MFRFWFNAFPASSRSLINDGALNYPDFTNTKFVENVKKNRSFEDFILMTLTPPHCIKFYSPKIKMFESKPKDFYPKIIKMEKRRGEIYSSCEFEFSNYVESQKESDFIICYLYLYYKEKLEELLKRDFNLIGKMQKEIEEAIINYKEYNKITKNKFMIKDLLNEQVVKLSKKELLNMIFQFKDETNISLSLIDGVESYINISNNETHKNISFNLMIKRDNFTLKSIATNYYSKIKNMYYIKPSIKGLVYNRKIKSRNNTLSSDEINVFSDISFTVSKSKTKQIDFVFIKKNDLFFERSLKEKIPEIEITSKGNDDLFRDALLELELNDKLSNFEKSTVFQSIQIESLKYKIYMYLFNEEKTFKTMDNKDILSLCLFFPVFEELENYLRKQFNTILQIKKQIPDLLDHESIIKSMEDLE